MEIPELREYHNFDDLLSRFDYDSDRTGSDYVACKMYDPEGKVVWKYFNISELLGGLVDEVRFLEGDNKL